MHRTRNHPTAPKPSCKNHPGVEASETRPGPDGKPHPLCASCAHYSRLAPKVMGAGTAPKKP